MTLDISEVWKSINYTPGIYDPSGIGWLITASYFLAAFLCLWTGIAERKRDIIGGNSGNHLIWFFLASVLSILGTNKQLDIIQTIAILTIRSIEIENGFSESGRFEFQIAFVVLVMVIGLALFIGMLWLIRKNWKGYWPALLGLAFIIGFLAIRTASFNYVDYPLSQWRVIGHVRMKYVVELAGILMVAAGAYYSRIRNSRSEVGRRKAKVRETRDEGRWRRGDGRGMMEDGR